MSYYKLTIKQQPRNWEKYGIIDANPDLAMFTRWYLITRGNGDDEIVIESADKDILLFTIAHGEEFKLQRLTVDQMAAIKQQRLANDFLAKWRQNSLAEGFYDGNY